jgi:hypothetical protein
VDAQRSGGRDDPDAFACAASWTVPRPAASVGSANAVRAPSGASTAADDSSASAAVESGSAGRSQCHNPSNPSSVTRRAAILLAMNRTPAPPAIVAGAGHAGTRIARPRKIRTVTVRETLAQEREPARELRLHRLDRHVERLRDLRRRLVLEVAQVDDALVRLAQVADGFVQIAVHLQAQRDLRAAGRMTAVPT